jgi:predicted dehydrogenase
MFADKLRNAAIAVLGCCGYNVQTRILPELRKLAPERLMGYDIKKSAQELPFPWMQVEDDAELARRLQEQRPNVVLVESPESCHKTHVKFALEAGAMLVLCEKPLGVGMAEATEVLALCRQARPQRHVCVLDHYRNVEGVQLLFRHARRWLGPIISIEVALLEDKEAHPVRDLNGMSGFIHHVPAIVGLMFEIRRLAVVTAAKARHCGAPVPDTYRSLVLAGAFPRPVTIRGAVGKRIAQPRRQITVTGTDGIAVLDRSTHELQVSSKDGWTMTMKTSPDTGYRGLARCLATGKPLPAFLSVEQALHCVRLVEEAHALAAELEEYPDGSKLIFGPPERRAA